MRMVVMLATGILLAACGAADASTTSDESGSTPDVSPAAPESGQGEGASAPDSGQVAVVVGAEIDGRRFASRGWGECRHAADASIYGMPSSMWLVQFSGNTEVRSVSLTLWRPKSGEADQLSLSITTPRGTARITTVQGGQTVGSGSVELELADEGGRLRVDGRDAEGNAVEVEVECDRFMTLEAVGG